MSKVGYMFALPHRRQAEAYTCDRAHQIRMHVQVTGPVTGCPIVHDGG